MNSVEKETKQVVTKTVETIICRRCGEPRYVYGTIGKFACTECHNTPDQDGFSFEYSETVTEV